MSSEIVKIQESDDGELFFQLPEKVLKELDWHEGDLLVWTDGSDGSVVVQRQYRNEPEQLDLFGGLDG